MKAGALETVVEAAMATDGGCRGAADWGGTMEAAGVVIASSSSRRGRKRLEVGIVSRGEQTGLFELALLCLLEINKVDRSTRFRPGVEKLEGSHGSVVSVPVSICCFPKSIFSPMSSLCSSVILLAFISQPQQIA